MEAAHPTALANGEVGIPERKPAPTLEDFAEHDFLPFVRATFAAKPKTLAYYENGVSRLIAFKHLARAPRFDHQRQSCRVCNRAPSCQGQARDVVAGGELEP